jgi:hypothetical protein
LLEALDDEDREFLQALDAEQPGLVERLGINEAPRRARR